MHYDRLWIYDEVISERNRQLSFLFYIAIEVLDVQPFTET